MELHLDHIVILVPYSNLLIVPKWITDNFSLTNGGQHADGKTENKLISFRDGSYIELIAFINDDPKHREGHWWGKKQPGIIDFAFTNRDGSATALYSELEARLATLQQPPGIPKVSYAPSVAGARKRPDGQEVKWEVTFPIVNTGYQRGELPFFCHDVTPRILRVPSAKENLTHPKGALGIKELHIYVPEEKVKALAKAYEAILGTENLGERSGQGHFHLDALHQVNRGEEEPFYALFHVQKPTKSEQYKAMEENGGLLIDDLKIFGKGTAVRWGY